MGTSSMRSFGHAYSGPDRRHHRLFVTKNSEYHCRDGVCVAVRDVRTGEFVRHHAALGRRLSGAIRFARDGSISGISEGTDAHVGEQLCFTAGSVDDPKDVLTSPVQAVARPPKEIAQHYPS